MAVPIAQFLMRAQENDRKGILSRWS